MQAAEPSFLEAEIANEILKV